MLVDIYRLLQYKVIDFISQGECDGQMYSRYAPNGLMTIQYGTGSFVQFALNGGMQMLQSLTGILESRTR